MIEVTEIRTVLAVTDGGNQLIVRKPMVTLIAGAKQGPAGPPGPQGPAGGGLTALQDDPNPTLGGDLNLNGFQIVGQVDITGFILDGGLV